MKNLWTRLQNLAEHRDFPTSWRLDPLSRTSEIDELICGLSELGELGPKVSWQACQANKSDELAP